MGGFLSGVVLCVLIATIIGLGNSTLIPEAWHTAEKVCEANNGVKEVTKSWGMVTGEVTCNSGAIFKNVRLQEKP